MVIGVIATLAHQVHTNPMAVIGMALVTVVIPEPMQLVMEAITVAYVKLELHSHLVDNHHVLTAQLDIFQGRGQAIAQFVAREHIQPIAEVTHAMNVAQGVIRVKGPVGVLCALLDQSPQTLEALVAPLVQEVSSQMQVGQHVCVLLGVT